MPVQIRPYIKSVDFNSMDDSDKLKLKVEEEVAKKLKELESKMMEEQRLRELAAQEEKERAKKL